MAAAAALLLVRPLPSLPREEEEGEEEERRGGGPGGGGGRPLSRASRRGKATMLGEWKDAVVVTLAVAEATPCILPSAFYTLFFGMHDVRWMSLCD